VCRYVIAGYASVALIAVALRRVGALTRSAVGIIAGLGGLLIALAVLAAAAGPITVRVPKPGHTNTSPALAA
jgi:hypothetical protein